MLTGNTFYWSSAAYSILEKWLCLFSLEEFPWCHGLKQGSNKVSDRSSLLTPTLPPEEGKRRKKERDLQLEYKTSFTNSNKNTNNINKKRNKSKYTKPILSFTELASCQQLPGSTRQSWTGLACRWVLDSGMHRLETGSGSQVEQQAGFSSEGSHGWRMWDPCDLPALKWVWCAWHGIPSSSILGHLSCPLLPTGTTFSNPSVLGPTRSVIDLDCYSDNYKQGLFSAFLSYHYLSVTVNIRCYQLWSWQCL